MRLKSRVKLSFKKFIPALKVSFGSGVITCLIKNADVFTDLPVPINTLQAVTKALQNILPEAATGNREAIETRNNIALEWDEIFARTAGYVSVVADGSKTIIEMAGFEPTKDETTRTHRPAGTESFTAGGGSFKNSVAAGTKRATRGAKGYGFVVAPTGAEITGNNHIITVRIGGYTVQFKAGMQKQVEIFNLPENVPVTVSMFAFNKEGINPVITSTPLYPR